MPTSKEAPSSLYQVIRNLDRAFSFDATYVERSKNDPLFAQLLGFEKYKDTVAKYEDKARTPTERQPTGG